MSEGNQNLLNVLRSVSEGTQVDLSALTDEEREVVEGLLAQFESRDTIKSNYNNLQERLEQLLDVLVEFAQFNFDLEVPISENADELDGIALGLQTLGQEIEYYQKQLKLTNDNLIEAQAMANIGSWEIRVDDGQMLWSDQMYKIYDLEPDGKERERTTEMIPKEDQDRLNRLFSRAVDYHEPYEITFQAKVNGKVKYIDAQAKPIFEGDEVVKVVGTAMDVTEKILARRKLEKLNQDLEAKVVERTKDLEGFSYTVSHDLRAPLRSITGFSNILEEEYKDQLPEEAQRLLGIIVQNAKKMSTLIEELLTFSRVGVTVPRFEKLSLSRIVSNAWAESRNAFDEPEKLNFKVSDLPEVFCTASMLHQVFVNLFSNAMKYSSNESQIHIEVALEETDDSYTVVSVSDNGCGFNMKYHDKLFGVFQRLHSEDEFKGTGVGLALVKRIVDKHQGRIWAESEVGKGAKFYVKLPIVVPTSIV